MRLLVPLLAINPLMFLLEATIGWFARSTALMADSLDMLADAAVFGIALLAVGRSARSKREALGRYRHGRLSARARLCRINTVRERKRRDLLVDASLQRQVCQWRTDLCGVSSGAG